MPSLALYSHSVHSISPKHGSTFNTCSKDFVPKYIECVTSCKRKIALGVAVRGDGGVAGEGRAVGIPKFHSWGKCTMPLTNINSDWMSKASSGLRIMLYYLYYADPLNCILGCNKHMLTFSETVTCVQQTS